MGCVEIGNAVFHLITDADATLLVVCVDHIGVVAGAVFKQGEGPCRHRLDLPRVAPQHVNDVLHAGDLVISVCDRAHEELATPIDIHWSVPDPVAAGDAAAFDEALHDLTRRVATLAPRLILTH